VADGRVALFVKPQISNSEDQCGHFEVHTFFLSHNMAVMWIDKIHRLTKIVDVSLENGVIEMIWIQIILNVGWKQITNRKYRVGDKIASFCATLRYH